MFWKIILTLYSPKDLSMHLFERRRSFANAPKIIDKVLGRTCLPGVLG